MNAELAATELGQAVARGAARAWLGGDAGSGLGELVRARVGRLRVRNSVLRQFGEISDAVYDRLEGYLEREFRGWGDEERRAVVGRVCAALNGAELGGEGHHPAEVVRRLVAQAEVEVEGGLAGSLFAECCEYGVRVVRALPVFDEQGAASGASGALGAFGTFGAFGAFGAEVARMLERLPDRSLFAPEGTDRDLAFRRRYLELVSGTLDEVELFRRGDRGVGRARLSVAYVSLRTTGARGPVGEGGRRRGRELSWVRPEMRDWEEWGGETAGLRAEAALSGAQLVLLRGEAGSGKTTLLRWLAVTAARGAFTGELADWNGLTPVLVKLREFSGEAPPGLDGILDSVAGPITGVMPKAWVEREFAGGSVLLLVDGVDELLDGERRGVREWLRKLLVAYPDVRVVVTSRPAAAGVDWLKREGFTALHLDQMTPPDIAAFVRQWHLAVRELGDDLPCAMEELPQYEQSLLNSLKDRAHLQSLAGTPLLASMLCAMHLNRGSQLPRDRMELYRSALHTLVHERDADRNVPSAAGDLLSLGDKMVLLRDLAWRLSDNNRSQISVEQAEVFVGRKLAGMRHLVEPDAGVVVAQLRGRSGVLRSPAEGKLDFVHRTFQEYLAAAEAVDEDRMGNLIERAHLDIWRETVIMAAGHANRRQREELLGGVLDRAGEEPRYARKLRLLAAACQETVPDVSSGLAGRLDRAVETLLPAQRPTDPPALAAVGPSLLRKTPRSLDRLSPDSAALTIQAVALIGGPEALSLLVGYTGDERGEVINELIDAWRYFDADAYASEVLAQLPLGGFVIQLSSVSQWRAAAGLRSVRSVIIEYPVTDLAPIAELAPLVALRLFNHRSTAGLAPLRNQPSLNYLHLRAPVSPADLDLLGELPDLNRLHLSHTDVKSWLGKAAFPPKLQHLYLQNCLLPDNPAALSIPGVRVEIS